MEIKNILRFKKNKKGSIKIPPLYNNNYISVFILFILFLNEENTKIFSYFDILFFIIIIFGYSVVKNFSSIKSGSYT